MDHPLNIIQITDTHLFAQKDGQYRDTNTYQTLQHVLDTIKVSHADIDLLLITGDLSQDGSAESYALLQQLVEPFNLLTYAIPGNHDTLATMQTALNPTFIKLGKTVQLGDWVFILLNSTIPNKIAGHLPEAELHFLDEQLQKFHDKHAIVCLHHHPVPCESTELDEYMLNNPLELQNTLEKHENVKAVLYGHIHQEFNLLRNHITYMATPSTNVQFLPHSDQVIIDTLPPGYRHLQLFNGEFLSDIHRIKS